MSRLGLIVNPVAGMGGRVALKGTDGLETIARARELGAEPLAAVRAERSLARLELSGAALTLVAAPGVMGADIAIGRRFEAEVLPSRGPGSDTTADDTRAAAGELLERGVDLILFAGGDGTTRDIHDVVGDRVPVLGIPTGVKMHSGVFATSPESAGDVAAHFFARGADARLRDGEVVDVDEDGLRAGRLSTHFYGVMRVPDDRLRVIPVKAGASSSSDEADLDAVCARIADGMDPRRLYVLGPGTTTRRIMRRLGLSATLLGVDVVRAGRLVAADLGEPALLRLLGREPATLIVGVVGGQGALFGRGNQQLSPAVIRRIGIDNVEIVAGLRKLLSLNPPLLHVDTGDPTLDAELAGYRRVHVAPGRTLVAKVAA
jgi:predicted polyphosphate/ATP-dependent NAD kinase